MIPSNELARIRTFPIIDYLGSIGRYPVKIDSLEYRYLSPFKNETTPSFIVDVHKNTFRDSGSLEGDIVQLVMKLERISFKEAVGRIISLESFDQFDQSAPQG